MLFKKLITAAAAAGLLVSFSASMTGCCNCSDDVEKEFSKELEKELDKEFEKMEKEAKKKTPKKVDKKAPKKMDDKKDTMAKKDEGTKMAAGGNAALKAMTPDSVQAKVKKLGWKVISKPTKVNDKSITLSVVKGSTGGAVSLNEFDVEIATDTFYKTMAKNEGAAIQRSGNKVISVVMPGKKAEAEKLLKKLMEN